MAYPDGPAELAVHNKGDGVGPTDTTHVVQPKGTSDTLGSENGHGVPRYMDETGANPVLENEAKTKGQWFAYVKTKQFWVAILLGQGKSFSSQSMIELRNYILTAGC